MIEPATSWIPVGRASTRATIGKAKWIWLEAIANRLRWNKNTIKHVYKTDAGQSNLEKENLVVRIQLLNVLEIRKVKS